MQQLALPTVHLLSSFYLLEFDVPLVLLQQGTERKGSAQIRHVPTLQTKIPRTRRRDKLLAKNKKLLHGKTLSNETCLDQLFNNRLIGAQKAPI